MPKYSEIEYWEQRYLDLPEPFDWLVAYKDVQVALAALIPDKATPILVIGCGNANLSSDMHSDGYTNQINIDLCKNVIAAQKERYPDMDWRVMDVLDLKFEDEKDFAVVLDKSMIDTLLCGEGAEEKVLAMFREALRVLKPGGLYLGWSLHTVQEVCALAGRLAKDAEWSFTTARIPNPAFRDEPSPKRAVAHTFFACRKPMASGERPEAPTILGALTDGVFVGLLEARDQLARQETLSAASVDSMMSALSSQLENLDTKNQDDT